MVAISNPCAPAVMAARPLPLMAALGVERDNLMAVAPEK
jgi:hypothetical protein